jgi:hypothetical protein
MMSVEMRQKNYARTKLMTLRIGIYMNFFHHAEIAIACEDAMNPTPHTDKIPCVYCAWLNLKRTMAKTQHDREFYDAKLAAHLGRTVRLEGGR